MMNEYIQISIDIKEMFIMKKILSVILSIVVLCSTLSGCSSSNNSNTVSNVQDSAVSSNEMIELTFWHLMSGAGADALNRQIDAFNKGIGVSEGIHVNTVYIDWPGTASFATALESNNSDNLPDVFQLYGNMVSYVTDLDQTMWAEDCITSDYSEITKNDFIPATLDAFTINGKLLALPYAISSMMLYYNKTYLEQAGYSNPPATIDEMASMMDALVEKTDAKYGLHASITDYELEHFLSAQGKNGTYITDNSNGRDGNVTKIICRDEIKSFLEEWGKVVSTGKVNLATRSTTEEFAAGIDAMGLMTSARIAGVDELVGDKFEWGVAPIPLVNSSDVGGSNVYGSSLVMFNHQNDKRTKATWKLMEYLVSPEAQTMLMEDMGYLPVNIKTVDYEAYQNAVNKQPQLGILFDVLNNASKTAVSVFFPNSSDIDKAMTNAIDRYCKNEITSDEATDTLINDCNKILDDYYKTNNQ